MAHSTRNKDPKKDLILETETEIPTEKIGNAKALKPEPEPEKQSRRKKKPGQIVTVTVPNKTKRGGKSKSKPMKMITEQKDSLDHPLSLPPEIVQTSNPLDPATYNQLLHLHDSKLNAFEKLHEEQLDINSKLQARLDEQSEELNLLKNFAVDLQDEIILNHQELRKRLERLTIKNVKQRKKVKELRNNYESENHSLEVLKFENSDSEYSFWEEEDKTRSLVILFVLFIFCLLIALEFLDK